MNEQTLKPSFGCDPEFFLMNAGNHHIVPSVGVFDGTKDEPYREEEWPTGFTTQEDNVMLEISVQPTYDVQSAVHVLKTAMLQTKTLARHKGYKLNFKEHHAFRPEQLESPQAKQIGCEVDFDAYTGGKARNDLPKLGTGRSAGGHIHLGGTFNCPPFVAAMFADLFILCSSTSFLQRDTTPRQQWYGQPGIYRDKPYGIEYRTPGNWWLESDMKRKQVIMSSFNLLNFLTKTPADRLNEIFKSVAWTDVRNIIQQLGGCEKEQTRYKTARDLVRNLNNQGVSV